MDAGHVISGTGHLALIGSMLFGGWFAPDEITPPPAMDVSLVTEADLAALSGPPQVVEAAVPAEEVAAPVVEEEVVAPEPEPEPQPEPEVAEAPEPEPIPEPEPEPAAPPEPEPAPEPQPELPAETAILVPERPAVTPRERPAPAERVAPDPAPAPPEEAAPDPVRQEEVAEADEAPEEPQEEQEATAPEEAGEVIEPEPEVVTAVERSVRPPSRPQRPVVADAPEPEPEAPAAEAAEEEPVETAAPAPEEAPADEPAEEPVETAAAEPAEEPAEDPLLAALSEAQDAEVAAAPEAAPAPTGPPLTGGEKDALRVSVQRCWNVGSLSSEALRTTVVVGVDMNEDGTPRTETIRLISFDGGTQSGADNAFQAARRAIIRCGGGEGFPLPVEKYGQWAQIEMVFNPDGMRVR